MGAPRAPDLAASSTSDTILDVVPDLAEAGATWILSNYQLSVHVVAQTTYIQGLTHEPYLRWQARA
eukprot:CAMPEP_0180646948 /NCGR_PEP_ID=MMETSP1037_2-20121125/49999_1 /TAXON_ID=632150 /ORGANISM="Azadinium spinosum, Strain 3D9" /LENGTH=65 /DNA_ID=CAMNT_0022671315 /DNA_START=30 /DNA_END=225 /DNA_ORIENTATION=+